MSNALLPDYTYNQDDERQVVRVPLGDATSPRPPATTAFTRPANLLPARPATLKALASDLRRELESAGMAKLPVHGERDIPEPILKGAMVGLLRGGRRARRQHTHHEKRSGLREVSSVDFAANGLGLVILVAVRVLETQRPLIPEGVSVMRA